MGLPVLKKLTAWASLSESRTIPLLSLSAHVKSLLDCLYYKPKWAKTQYFQRLIPAIKTFQLHWLGQGTNPLHDACSFQIFFFSAL